MPRFKQPCAAFQDGRCQVYEHRPLYCRQFECLLLKRTLDGRVKPAAALKLIQAAKERANKVRRLLGELGDSSEDLALSVRFRRMTKRFEQGGMDSDATDLYGELTLAMHDLNLLLGQAFYPGPAPA
jgi:uncharacterized protein